MCGFVGTVGGAEDRAEALFGAALATLSARGPDGGQVVQARLGDRPVRLGARWLALHDRTGGAQPLRLPSGAVLAWNGEIYNHAALRDLLGGRGVRWEQGGDGEILAHLLEQEGVEGLRRVEGSFAFAFLSASGTQLWLGRDAAGVRPLCYARTPDGVVFASTLDALRATRAVPIKPDVDAITDVLRDGVVSTPRTALLGVRRVAPGEVIGFDADMRPSLQAIPCAERHGPRPEPELPDVLQALRAAVRDRLFVDRPAGVLLSGGIDSALIAALAAEQEPTIPTFTLGYPFQEQVDESARAQQTAARLGLHHEHVPCPKDPTSWVLGAARAFDEPFADASAVPCWGLGKAVGRSVRVVLSGTGGDEVFGGYRRYWLLGAGPWLRQVPRFLREGVGKALRARVPSGARLLEAAGDPEGLYRGLLRLQPLAETRRVAGPLLDGVADPEPRTGPRTAWDAMAEDLTRYLPDDLLVKEDRAFMAHGVEGRHPFLDGRVRRAARDLELKGSVGRGRQKHVLRAYVREVIDSDLARVAKHGFAFPVDALYRGALRDLAEDCLLGRAARERGFVSPAGARRLLQDHWHGVRDGGQTIHALVMLELWAARVLDA